jgi:hypothetical protein
LWVLLYFWWQIQPTYTNFNYHIANDNAILVWCFKNRVLHTSCNTHNNRWLSCRSLLWSTSSLVSTGYIHCLFPYWTIQFFYCYMGISTTPVIIGNFYRGWLCMSMASETFIVHDIMFRYLPSQFYFLLFWASSTIDM